MKKIENIADRFRDVFDSEEPSSNHLENFAGKLRMYSSKRKNTRLFYRYSIVVATAAAALLLLLPLYMKRTQPIEDVAVAGQLPPEIRELEHYYEHIIQPEMNMLQASISECPSRRKEAQNCMNELNKSLRDIQKDLEENPGDELVINAMVNHYQIRIEVVNQLINSTRDYCF